jgi:hypothetical protein
MLPLYKASAIAVPVGLVCALLSGCGLQISSPDLFLLKRSGEGTAVSLLVNDGGTIRCNGGQAEPLPDALLISARDLASQLDKDVKAQLRVPAGAHSVFTYSVRLQGGTISFPDIAAAAHHELALAEQFALQAEQGPCGLSR